MRDGWSETTFGDVFKIVTGKYVAKEDYVEGGEFWIYGSNSIMGKLDRFLVQESHVIMAAIGAYAGAVRYSKEPSWINNNAMALVPSENVLAKYLHLWLESKFDLKRVVVGTGQPYVQRPLLLKELIALPPLPEQKRIVDLISSVDSYIQALQQQLDSAKRSRNAVLHELLTAGGADWVETTLGEVTQINPEQAKDFDSERLIKYVDLSSVTFDDGIDSEIDPIPFNEAPGRARRIVRENDVIVATVRPYLKGFAFVNKDFNEQIASTGFCVIRAQSELVLPEIVWALVGSDDFVDFLIGRSTGSSYPAVRPIDISEFNFMLPPFKDQETISQLIRTFDQLIKDSTDLINSTQNLRSGLLSNLLGGKHEIPASYDKVIGAA